MKNDDYLKAYAEGFMAKCAEAGVSVEKIAGNARLGEIGRRILAMAKATPQRDVAELQRKSTAFLDGIDPLRKGDRFGNLKWHGGFVMPERGVGNKLPIPYKRRFRTTPFVADYDLGGAVPPPDARIRAGFRMMTHDNVDWTR